MIKIFDVKQNTHKQSHIQFQSIILHQFPENLPILHFVTHTWIIFSPQAFKVSNKHQYTVNVYCLHSMSNIIML